MSNDTPFGDQLKPLTLRTLAKGKLEKQFQKALREIEASIDDEERDATASRSVTIKIVLEHSDGGFKTTSEVKVGLPPLKKRGGMAALMRDPKTGRLRLHSFNEGEQQPLPFTPRAVAVGDGTDEEDAGDE